MIEIKPEEQAVLDYWNSKKQEPIEKRGKDKIVTIKWKTGREINLALRNAIRLAIKNTSLDSLKSAIDNYAKICFGKEYYWTYCWSLYDFLTRKRDGVKTDFKWYQFLPDNFCEEEKLTAKAKNDIIFRREEKLRKEKMENSKPIRSIQNLTSGILKKDEKPTSGYNQEMKLALIRSER